MGGRDVGVECSCGVEEACELLYCCPLAYSEWRLNQDIR